MVLQRKVRGRIHFTNSDRLFLIQLYRSFPSVLRVGGGPAAQRRGARVFPPEVRLAPLAEGEREVPKRSIA